MSPFWASTLELSHSVLASGELRWSGLGVVELVFGAVGELWSGLVVELVFGAIGEFGLRMGSLDVV